MLEASKSRVFEKIFGIYNRNLLKRRFHSLQVAGSDNLAEKPKNKPLIVYANHSSWWDGLVAFEVLRRYNFENYVMMEEKHLVRLSFFRKLGAFSVDRQKPREALKSITYIAQLLSENSSRVLLIFPQGQILPNDFRPIRFFRGIAKIIEKTGDCLTTSLSIRYEFLENFKPEILVRVGKLENIVVNKNFEAKSLTAHFENQLTDQLEKLKNDILQRQTKNYLKYF